VGVTKGEENLLNKQKAKGRKQKAMAKAGSKGKS
jgi:hypothetical protein